MVRPMILLGLFLVVVENNLSCWWIGCRVRTRRIWWWWRRLICVLFCSRDLQSLMDLEQILTAPYTQHNPESMGWAQIYLWIPLHSNWNGQYYINQSREKQRELYLGIKERKVKRNVWDYECWKIIQVSDRGSCQTEQTGCLFSQDGLTDSFLSKVIEGQTLRKI